MKLIDFLSLTFMCPTCDYFIYYGGELVYKGDLSDLSTIPESIKNKYIVFFRPSMFYNNAVFSIFLEDANA